MDVVNRIFLKRSSFNSIYELLDEINKQLIILINNGYATSIYRSLMDENIYIIEYASLDPSINDTFVLPMWVTSDEAKALEGLRALKNQGMELPKPGINKKGGKGGGGIDA